MVAVIDMGFNIYHPDYQPRIWTNTAEVADSTDTDGNGYKDDLAGWNFADFDNDVSSTNPHGTAVAGIVAGDGLAGTLTGVAPEAVLMLLRVGDDVTEKATQQAVWDALQYAGKQGADIVNLSMRWRKEHIPDLPAWREAIDTAVNELELLVVTVAGNDADYYAPPESITTPGNVPSAMTVGATDPNDDLWYDASLPGLPVGSNTGPVTWQDVAGYGDFPDPPGLMKPDVVAPGVGITSTYLSIDTEYYRSTHTATSYAAPHASGLAALLLGQDPDLGPHDLRFLIQESAVDLPSSGAAPGPDMSFGWGRIDAGAAMALLPIDATPYDLSITETSSEWTSVDIWVDNDDDGVEDTPIAEHANHLYARVRNLGGQVAGDVDLAFYYADLATTGTSDFDPNGDGDPADGSFDFIGIYTVPLLGPAGSDHAQATGLVKWEIPLPTSDHWCVGVAAVTHAPTPDEVELKNNRAFRNFFELLMMTSMNVEFRIAPPRGRETEPFDLVVRREDMPPEARLHLRVAPELAPAFGLEPGPLERRPSPEGPPAELRSLPLRGRVARLRGIQAPGGESIPVSLAVRVPPEVALPEGARVVVSVLDGEGVPVGGLTVKLRRATGPRAGGPYSPR